MKQAVNAALSYAEGWLRRPTPIADPVILDIVLTKACNLRCSFCISYASLAQTHWLDYGLYQRIAAELFPTAWDVQFCSGGEPFLYPQIREALQLARHHGCKTGVTTNAMLIDDRVATWLVEDQTLDRMWVSFDGGTKETLERLRLGARFDKIIANVRNLVAKRRAAGARFPMVDMRFVMMRSNVAELARLIELAADLGVRRVEGRYLNVANDMDRDESLFHHRGLAAEEFARARAVAEAQGVRLSLPPLPGEDRGRHRCIKPWEMCQIDVDGSIRFCYKSWRQRLGNFDDGFSNIWRGEHYQRLRATMDSTAPYFPYCRTCAMRIGIDNESAHDQSSHAEDYVIPGLEHWQTDFNARAEENRDSFAERKDRLRGKKA
ncbi:MAG TPA: radical SAM protein [Beijerinckiaceae bacterium]|nr:radical SAM protein [Beijerinckiaceae bacterium]